MTQQAKRSEESRGSAGGRSASKGGGTDASAASRLLERSRELSQGAAGIAKDAQGLAGVARDITADAEAALREQLKERPYLTLGAAVGIGYVLGGGIPSRLAGILFSVGTRLVLASAAQRLLVQGVGNAGAGGTSKGGHR
jgi:hypothetical protein